MIFKLCKGFYIGLAYVFCDESKIFQFNDNPEAATIREQNGSCNIEGIVTSPFRYLFEMNSFFRSKYFIVCKTILFFLVLEFAGENCVGQGGMWTWVSGSDSVYCHGIFGTMGVADSANHPPALYEPAHWVDHDGNFWLYGGLTVHGPGFNALSCALWKYDVSADKWTWMNGSSSTNEPAISGIQGIPSANNNPGGRSLGMLTWIDSNDNLWLYGGVGLDPLGQYGAFSNLWKYSITTNEWTWVWGYEFSGFGSPYFHSYQTFHSANEPGPLNECQMSWSDDLGHLGSWVEVRI